MPVAAGAGAAVLVAAAAAPVPAFLVSVYAAVVRCAVATAQAAEAALWAVGVGRACRVSDLLFDQLFGWMLDRWLRAGPMTQLLPSGESPLLSAPPPAWSKNGREVKGRGQ